MTNTFTEDYEALKLGAHKAAVCELIRKHPEMSIETLENYFDDDEAALEALRSVTFEEIFRFAKSEEEPSPVEADLPDESEEVEAAPARAKRSTKKETSDKAKPKTKRAAPPRVISSSSGNNIDGKIASFIAESPGARRSDIISSCKIEEAQFRPAILRLIEAKTIKKVGVGRGAGYQPT